ncbi:MAG: TonB-dependent receptor [Gammaproteobacteria bacterium]
MKAEKKRLSIAILTALLPAGLLAAGAGTAWAQDQDEARSEMALEEVIVTARKLEDTIQEVPVAVTAISADMIQDLGVQNLTDISKITAGLIFDSEFARGANRPVIRGQANILGDSGVSYFIDGVYISGSIDAYDLNDVERIEVVKGPQSALYGRNTYAGAINIITRSPGEEFNARVKLEAAQDDQYEIAASMSGPFTDTIAGGISVRHFELGGFFTNQFDGQKIGEQESDSVSGVLEFTPSEDLMIRARAYYAERDDGQPAVVATRYTENNCYFDNGTSYAGAGRYYCGVVPTRRINTDWPVQAPDQRDTDEELQASLQILYDFNDNWSLASITGYNDYSGEFYIDGDYLPTSFQVSNFTGAFPLGDPTQPGPWGYAGAITDFTFATATDRDDWSQELRFEYQGDNITALFGGYYFDQNNTSRDIREISPEQFALADANVAAETARVFGTTCVNIPTCAFIIPLVGDLLVPRDVNRLDIENYALFGLVSWDFADNWSLTAEARWQEEKIEQNVIVQDLGGAPVFEPPANASFDAFLPRVTVDWQATDNTMLYALYAMGTKPGGFNSTVAIEAGLPTYDEEDVDTFEIGAKNVFDDGRLVANFAAFYNDVQGYQLTQNARSGQNTTSATVNVGDADIYGIEAEIMAQVSDNLRATINYAWTDTEFYAGVDQNQGVLDDVLDNGLVDCSTGNEFPDLPGCTSKYGSIVGKQIPRTAEHQVFADLEYRRAFTMGGAWEWYGGLNYVFESSKYAQVHNLAETGDAKIVNARFGIENDRWSIQLWGRNLTGEDTPYNVLRYAEPELFRRNFAISPRRDTYYGITAIARF